MRNYSTKSIAELLDQSSRLSSKPLIPLKSAIIDLLATHLNIPASQIGRLSLVGNRLFVQIDSIVGAHALRLQSRSVLAKLQILLVKKGADLRIKTIIPM